MVEGANDDKKSKGSCSIVCVLTACSTSSAYTLSLPDAKNKLENAAEHCPSI